MHLNGDDRADGGDERLRLEVRAKAPRRHEPPERAAEAYEFAGRVAGRCRTPCACGAWSEGVGLGFVLTVKVLVAILALGKVGHVNCCLSFSFSMQQTV